MAKHIIKEEHIEYYQFLEMLRKSGRINMFCALPYLTKAYNIDPKYASSILKEWMDNYETLAKTYGW